MHTASVSQKHWFLIGGIGSLIVACAIGVYVLFIAPPLTFPEHTLVSVEEGQTLSEVTDQFARQDLIRSRLAFRMLAIMMNGEHRVVAGDYYFTEPVSVMEVASRVTSGHTAFQPRRVTIPEGVTAPQIARILENKLISFDPVTFLRHARDHEGFLFPDTYQLHATADEASVVEKMVTTFTERIEPLKERIQNHRRSLTDIVTMASILEGEAATREDWRLIAGILWKRIEEGMPLQVDAAFEKVNGKNSYELTTEDLQRDDPFNTYTNTGLPPHPINNPGLASIKAALNPKESEYWYYLSDRDGNLYYSKTLREHQRKKEIYVN